MNTGFVPQSWGGGPHGADAQNRAAPRRGGGVVRV